MDNTYVILAIVIIAVFVVAGVKISGDMIIQALINARALVNP